MHSLHSWPILPFNLEPSIARSLSIQFILQEWIASFEWVRFLQKITPAQIQDNSLQEEITVISEHIEQLFFFSLENPFSVKKSTLDKLCFYCENLLEISRNHESAIPMILEEMRNVVLKMRSKIISWKKMPDRILTLLLELYEDLNQSLRQFFYALKPFLQEARSDENVLVFLIENKQKLNSFLGKHHIEEMLKSFFPAGHDQLRAAVIEGYTRRGFTTFLEKVEPLIDAIEWETANC